MDVSARPGRENEPRGALLISTAFFESLNLSPVPVFLKPKIRVFPGNPDAVAKEKSQKHPMNSGPGVLLPTAGSAETTVYPSLHNPLKQNKLTV